MSVSQQRLPVLFVGETIPEITLFRGVSELMFDTLQFSSLLVYFAFCDKTWRPCHYFASYRRGCKVLQSVCLCGCLSVRSRISKTTRSNFSPNFLYMLPVAVVQSTFDGTGIRYVLPGLWMTSYFHIMQRMCLIVVNRLNL